MLVAFFALDLDRREHVAVALGDREMQAKLVRHELLELLANRRDQRAIRAEVLRVVGDARARAPERRMLGSAALSRGAPRFARRLRLGATRGGRPFRSLSSASSS